MRPLQPAIAPTVATAPGPGNLRPAGQELLSVGEPATGYRQPLDFTDSLQELEPNRRMVASWLLSSGLRLDFLCAAGSRLALLALVQLFRRPNLIVGAVSCEASALERLRRHQPGLLLCTDQLEQGDGFSLVSAARQLIPDLRVVMILTHRQPEVDRALALRVQGLLLESDLGTGDRPLARALLAAATGRAYLSAGAEAAMARPQPAAEGPQTQLTPREQEVLTLIISGCTDREIAEQLNLSPETVRGYTKDIRRKFGARSRVELLGKALRKAMGRRRSLR